MEKKPFRFGKGSFALVLPKKWADDRQLTFSSNLYLKETEDGSLMISSVPSTSSQAEEDVSNLSSKLISRLIGFHHMCGTKRLRLYSREGFAKEQVRAIYGEVRDHYLGCEIVSQGKNEIVIEDLSNHRDMGIDKIVSRMCYLTGEAFESCISGDAKSLANYEELVNRYYVFGVRYLNIERPKNIYPYLRVVQMLELVCDMLVLISKTDQKPVSALLERAREHFEMSAKAMKGEESVIISAINSGEALLDQLESSKLTDHQSMIFEDLIWSTIAIAEAGIIWRKPSFEQPQTGKGDKRTHL